MLNLFNIAVKVKSRFFRKKSLIRLKRKFRKIMQVQPQKYQGLVADLLPNIRLMQAFGHFLFKFVSGPVMFRKIYSFTHLFLLLFQFVTIILNLAFTAGDVNELTSNTITTLFFTHSITKFLYFGINSKNFYR